MAPPFSKNTRVEIMGRPDWWRELRTADERVARRREIEASGQEWRKATGECGIVLKCPKRTTHYAARVLLDPSPKAPNGVEIDYDELMWIKELAPGDQMTALLSTRDNAGPDGWATQWEGSVRRKALDDCVQRGLLEKTTLGFDGKPGSFAGYGAYRLTPAGDSLLPKRLDGGARQCPVV